MVLADGLHPVAPGMPGELIVTGSGLADGYVGDETLTSARFISLPQEYGRRGYRTGDGARLLPSGDFDCLGRLDRQLKVRGFRLEPSDVESVLRQHPDVRQAVAFDVRTANGPLLCAAVEPAGLDGAALRQFVSGRLPRWFLPGRQPLNRVLGCSRADVLVEDGRPRFLEFNFGACLDGATSTPVLARALMESAPGLDTHRAHGITTQSVFAARLAWVKDHLPPGTARLALLGFARDGDEGSLRAFELEAAHHSANGLSCDFVPFDEAEVGDDALHRRGNTYLFQRTDLPPDQERLLDFVPWTARLAKQPARRGGEVVDVAEWTANHRERAVLKPSNAFGSRGVVLGDRTPAGEWERVAKEAVRAGDHVVQEAVDPGPWPLTYWDLEREEIRDVLAPVLLGPFQVMERSGGCSTKQPGVNDAGRLVRSRDGLSFGCIVVAGE